MTVASKTIKYSGVNQEGKDIRTLQLFQNYKTLLKEKQPQTMEHRPCSWIRRPHSLNVYATQSNPKIQCNLYQNTSDIFTHTKKAKKLSISYGISKDPA